MNYEIELKAHVVNRNEVINKLNSFCTYKGHTEKYDDYFHFPVKNPASNKPYIAARIRKEKLTFNSSTQETFYFTYKRKEVKKNDDGTEIEVNEENEFTFNDAQPLQTLFFDLGATIDLHKEKSVEQWILETEGETAHIELCTVPPLGDFLEIEIIKDYQNDEIVQKLQQLIKNIFIKCNINLNQIEPRYYSDMLKNTGKTDFC